MAPDLGDILGLHLQWCRLANLRPATIRGRSYMLRRVQTEIGPLLSITPDDLAQWQMAHQQDWAPQSMYSYVAHIAAFYTWAVRYGHAQGDPTARMVRPKLPQRLPHPIAEDDLELAIKSASERIRPWLCLAAYAGLRAGEIAGLHREHVRDRDDPPTLLVADGKGGKQRIIPLGEHLLSELRPYLRARGPMWTRADGRPGPVNSGIVSDVCNKHLHSLGIAETLHSARHRFATRVYQDTRDLLATGRLLGHSSPSATAGYAASSSSEAVDAVRRLDGRLTWQRTA